MTASLGQSDAIASFSDCSIASLLPRTLGPSLSAGGAMLESDDQDIVSNLFKSAALKNTTNLLENAKKISNSSSSIPNASSGDGNTVSANKTEEDKIELHIKRARQRRPGLSGVERGEIIFNFSAKTNAVEASQIGTSHLSKRSSCTESNSQSWPVIDYSCLQNITDPTEYFSTYRMLENAEKEIKRLKGDVSPRLSQPQGGRDRQRRPGLSDLEGKKFVFKFPGIDSNVEASSMENSSLSNISQTENSDSDVDKEIDEFERLMSKCRALNSDELGIANIVRNTVQINPIHSKFEGHQLRPVSPVTEVNRIDGLPTLKGHSSVINRQGNPLFLHNRDGEKQSNDSKEYGSSSKDLCGDGTKKLPWDEKGKETFGLEKLKSDLKDLRVDGISESEQETLKMKPLDSKEMTSPVDHLSALKNTIPLIDIQGRLDKISTLKSQIFQIITEGENLVSKYDDSDGSSLRKSREVQTLSPLDSIHVDGSPSETKNACIPHLPNGKRLSFVDDVHSPAAEILEADKNVCNGRPSDPKGLISGANFEEGSTNVAEQTLPPDIPNDQCLPTNPNVTDEQMDAPSKVLNGRNKNQRHSEASRGSGSRKSNKKVPPSRRKKQKQILRRQSLAGAGTVWETGVRRSTRIRVKPLQYWCGERLLYGRVHDSLATVIGVKKFGTPQSGKTSVMKVESYVPEQYADLVALAALH